MDIVFTVLTVWVVMGIECVICRYVARQDNYWCDIILCIDMCEDFPEILPEDCKGPYLSKEDIEILLKIYRRAFFCFRNTRRLLWNIEKKDPGFAAACKAGRYLPPEERPVA